MKQWISRKEQTTNRETKNMQTLISLIPTIIQRRFGEKLLLQSALKTATQHTLYINSKMQWKAHFTSTKLWQRNNHSALTLSWTHMKTNKVHTLMRQSAVRSPEIPVCLPTRKSPTMLCGYDVIFLGLFYTFSPFLHFISSSSLLSANRNHRSNMHSSAFICFKHNILWVVLTHCSVTF